MAETENNNPLPNLTLTPLGRATAAVLKASRRRLSLPQAELLVKAVWNEPAPGYVSDGHHTFDQLYNYRMLYNAGFFNMLALVDKNLVHPLYDVHKSWFHSDQNLCFGGGWFIVMAYLPDGQISNHYPADCWEYFNIPDKEFANEYDEHKPEDVEERIKKFLLGASND